ncbi:hypothetical protein TrLO_g8673 [Triparma laevis f. longispina]|uniref:tRNA(Ile)-lysidine synthetase n=1 Tax=Triparma laevis f. longispina TaxID=1714387 RepID=A0A9W6Z9X5_9STRA|nr:hypothetical protein TrLO_g8673 [Triparma laevis f. longispina]
MRILLMMLLTSPILSFLPSTILRTGLRTKTSLSSTLPNLLTSTLTPHLSPTSRIALSCSGGIDSMSLLKSYITSDIKHPIDVVHFNHRTRSSMEHERDVECISNLISNDPRCTLKVITNPSSSPFTQTLSSSWRKKHLSKYSIILTAHHFSDSIESQILKLTRGTSILNLKGIEREKYLGGGCLYLRPFVHLNKEELREFLGDVEYNQDESNYDEEKGKRNYVRNKLLPIWKEMDGKVEERFRGLEEEVEEIGEFLESEIIKRSELFEGEEFNVVGREYDYIDKLSFRRFTERYYISSKPIFDKIWEKIKSSIGKGPKWSLDLGGGWIVKFEKGVITVTK